MRLGDLIATLEALPQDAPVRFPDGQVPNGLCSWRGVYAELTIDRAPAGETETIGEMLADARDAVGKTFQGYKGGDFLMDETTPVWADGWGDCNHIAPAGFAINDGLVVIATSDLSDYRGW